MALNGFRFESLICESRSPFSDNRAVLRGEGRGEYYHKPVHVTTIRIHLRAENSSP
jgi:hypothetical protein